MQAEGNRNKEVILEKVDWCSKVTSPQGMAEIYEADYLTSADPVLPDWFKIPSLVETKLQLSLGLVTWGLAPFCDPILGLLSCLQHFI